MTYHHYQYEAETEVVANDEHLPSSLMRGEVGNQGVRILRQHQLSAGSSPGQLTACDVWCRHGTGGLRVLFQQVFQAMETGKFLTPTLALPRKRSGRSDLTPRTICSRGSWCFRGKF